MCRSCTVHVCVHILVCSVICSISLSLPLSLFPSLPSSLPLSPSLSLSGLSSLPVDACTFIKATSLTPGHTKLTVTYTHGLLQLEASVTIASYHALRSIDPEEFALVTIGSSKTFIFEGGPSPWVLDPSKYFRKCKSYW